MMQSRWIQPEVQLIQVTEKEKMGHHGLSWLLLGVKRGTFRANLQQRWGFEVTQHVQYSKNHWICLAKHWAHTGQQWYEYTEDWFLEGWINLVNLWMEYGLTKILKSSLVLQFSCLNVWVLPANFDPNYKRQVKMRTKVVRQQTHQIQRDEVCRLLLKL